MRPAPHAVSTTGNEDLPDRQWLCRCLLPINKNSAVSNLAPATSLLAWAVASSAVTKPLLQTNIACRDLFERVLNKAL
jgi:hypothetical protein